MTRGVNAQQFAAIERDAGVVGCFDDAFGWDRQDFTVDFFHIVRAVNRAHAGDEFGWLDHVTRAARMHDEFGVREFLHH